MRSVSACCSRSSASSSAGSASSSRCSLKVSFALLAAARAACLRDAGSARAGAAAAFAGPLGDPVAVAADVFLPRSRRPFRDQRLRDHVVEERPVVAHQQQRPRITTAALPRAVPAIRCRGRWWVRRAPAGSPAARTAARAAGDCARRRTASSPARSRAAAQTGSRRDRSARACRPPAVSTHSDPG